MNLPVDDPRGRLRWGDPAQRPRIRPGAWRWLRRHVGPWEPAGSSTSPAGPAEPPGPARSAERAGTAETAGTGGTAGSADPALDLPEPALTPAARRDLVTVVGPAGLRTDPAARLSHAGGLSYPDLARRRGGVPVPAPDGVLLPADHGQVLAVLATCSRHDIAVIPFGGGTSVVGGVEALRGGHAAVLAVDTSRLDQLHDLDRLSLTATLGAGLTGPGADRLLAEHGLMLGHVPQSYQRATLGGFAAARSAGQASAGVGRFDELVTALVLATPRGELRLGRAPASAAGPDLRQLVLGSEGTFGVITQVSLRVRPRPRRRRYEAWSFGSFEAGSAAVRRLAQTGTLADVTRLSDPVETESALVLAGPAGQATRYYLRVRGHRRPGLLVLGWEGDPSRRRRAARVLRCGGGIGLGRPVGAAWERDRFGGPYLRDTLLDGGALVETVETAASWSVLPELRAAVSHALHGELDTGHRLGGSGSALVLCHLSHAYPTGASLYFTVIAAPGPDPIARWQRAKQAAGQAIMAVGGTISHHHGIGTDHRAWLTDEIGELGVEVLRAVKDRLDPRGICNPGKLLP